MTDREFLKSWVTGKRGQQEVKEFNKLYGLIPDTEAIKETVEVGLSFEKANQKAEAAHQNKMPVVREE